MNKVKLPVIVSGISTKVDGSIKIVLETRELPAENVSTLFELRNQEAWAVLAQNDVSYADVPEAKADSLITTKTPSQRLRNVMFILWKQGGSRGDFEGYYRNQMEQLLELLKGKIDE